VPGLPAAAVAEIFRTAQDASASVEGNSPTERIVFRVTEIKVPPLDAGASNAKQLADALKTRVAEDLASQYVGAVESEIGVSINQNALNQVNGASQN
jgi:peptidyl-prolyl cis-trans isomerase D